MLGQIIKKARARKRITQQELANYLGTSKATVYTWEKNMNVPSGEMLIKIIEKLDIAEELFPQKKVQGHKYSERFEKLEQEVKDLKNVVSLLLEKIQKYNE